MAVSFTNVIVDNVIESLHTLIADEFNTLIMYDKHEGNQSFLIQPVSDELVEILASGQTRDYTINISYRVEFSGNYTKTSVKQFSNIAERLKRLLYNNRNYSVSGTTKFYNAVVNNIEYVKEDKALLANSEVTVSVLEAI